MYLGCPLYLGRLKESMFEDTILKIKKRMAAWENLMLSFGGKMVLVKSILSSMPIHLFHIMQPPGGILKKLDKILNAFVWGSKEEAKRIHWRRWDKLCFPYEEGGMGFRLNKDMTMALAMKTWWRFRTHDSLWSQFMRSKYARIYQINPMVVKRTDSHCWKRMSKAQIHAEPNIMWGIGKGKISFWNDQWLGEGRLSDCVPARASSMEKVEDYMDNGNWDFNKLKGSLPITVVNHILTIPIGEEDWAMWRGAKDNNFTCSLAWNIIRQRRRTNRLLKRLWHKNFPLKMSAMAWRTINNLLPTDQKLKAMGLVMPSRCQCCSEEESITHIFLDSPIAKEVWIFLRKWFNCAGGDYRTMEDLLGGWALSHDWIQEGHIRLLIPIIVIWYLWKARNEAKHNNIKITAKSITCSIEKKIEDLIKIKAITWKNCRGEEAFSQHFNIEGGSDRRRKCTYFNWLKPPIGCLKLNIDGCAKGNPGPAAAGGIIRDWNGKFLMAFSRAIGHQTAFTAELMALLLGLRICTEMNIKDLWIESDSMLLCQQINQRNRGNWKTYRIIWEIAWHLRKLHWRITHIWREGNVAADFLAGLGLRHQQGQTHIHSRPSGELTGILRLDACELGYLRLH